MTPDHVIQHTLNDLDLIAEAISMAKIDLVDTVLEYRRAQLARYLREGERPATMGRMRDSYRPANTPTYELGDTDD